MRLIRVGENEPDLIGIEDEDVVIIERTSLGMHGIDCCADHLHAKLRVLNALFAAPGKCIHVFLSPRS